MDFKPFLPPPDFRAFAEDASPATIKKVMTMYTHPSTTQGEKDNAASILKSMGVPLPKTEPVKPKPQVTPTWWKQQEQPKAQPKGFTYSATWLPNKTQWMIHRSDGKVAYISSVYAATKDLALNLASKPGIMWY